jgi:hypothetical protein
MLLKDIHKSTMLILLPAISCTGCKFLPTFPHQFAYINPTLEMPVTTRRQANHTRLAHADSHLNLNNLPAEIIEEIAYHLKSDAGDSEGTATDPSTEFEDVNVDLMSVTSIGSEDDVPDVPVMPCCRPGDLKKHSYGSRIPVLDDRSVFSATSKRIREIVFHRRQRRRRTIRYCPQWLQETQQVPLAIRARYM